MVVVVTLLENLVSREKQVLFYFNKKGQFLQATPESIGFLLQKDKDLLIAYSSEKKKDIEVFKKYLLLMNERYPL